MEGKDKRDVDAEVVLQVSQEHSQPTESDSDQAIVVSTVSATFPFPTNNPSYCSYDYNILQNIRCENDLPEHIRKDITEGDSVGDRIASGLQLQNVKCEQQGQELNEGQAILSFMNTDKTSASTYDVIELTKVKREKADPDEYGRNSDETRHWIVCQDGVLKEVKAEHTLDVSDDILAVDDGSHNVDQKRRYSSTHHATMECQLTVPERTGTCVKPFTCDTCGKSLVISAEVLKVLARTNTGMNPYTCHMCRRSLAMFVNRRMQETVHTCDRSCTCDTCGK